MLNRAAATSDPVERMQFVAAFAVSGYAYTRYRTGRKGLYVGSIFHTSVNISQSLLSNPMLAETFEDSRMKFIAEKVRHNPVELAYHAEGDNWEVYATSSGKTKFWGTQEVFTEYLPTDYFSTGKSLEIIPLGTTHLKIGNDHYQWWVLLRMLLISDLSSFSQEKAIFLHEESGGWNQISRTCRKDDH